MGDSPAKPHVVQRKPATAKADAAAVVAAAEPAKKVVEARPTCKLDKNELLGLVGNMRTPTSDPDAEPELEMSVSDAGTTPAQPMIPIAHKRSAVPIEKRIVRTVARRTPIAGMAPLVAPTPVAEPVAKPVAASSDQYVDLFAEGSEPAIEPMKPPIPESSSVTIEPAQPRAEAVVAAPLVVSASEPVAAVVDDVIELPVAELAPVPPIVTAQMSAPTPPAAVVEEPLLLVRPAPEVVAPPPVAAPPVVAASMPAPVVDAPKSNTMMLVALAAVAVIVLVVVFAVAL